MARSSQRWIVIGAGLGAALVWAASRRRAAIRQQADADAEEALDAALADSFPSSDPPAFTQGTASVQREGRTRTATNHRSAWLTGGLVAGIAAAAVAAPWQTYRAQRRQADLERRQTQAHSAADANEPGWAAGPHA